MLPRRPWWWGTVAAEAAGVAWRVARADAASHEHGTWYSHACYISYLKKSRSTRQHSQNHTGGVLRIAAKMLERADRRVIVSI